MTDRDDGLTIVLPPEAVPAIKAAVKAWERRQRPARDLAVEIEAYVRAEGPATSDEIRRAIRARAVDVRHMLKTNARFALVPCTPPNRRRGTKCWALAHEMAPTVPAPGTRHAEGVGD